MGGKKTVGRARCSLAIENWMLNLKIPVAYGPERTNKTPVHPVYLLVGWSEKSAH